MVVNNTKNIHERFAREYYILYLIKLKHYILLFLFRHTLLHGNRNCDRCADHRVVAHAD